MREAVVLTNTFITLMEYNGDFYRSLKLLNNRYMKQFCIEIEDEGKKKYIFKKTYNDITPGFRERIALRKAFRVKGICSDESMYMLMNYLESDYPSETNSDLFYAIPFIIPLLGSKIRCSYNRLCEEMHTIEDKGDSVFRLFNYIKPRKLSVTLFGERDDESVMDNYDFLDDNEYERYKKIVYIGRNISRNRIMKDKKDYAVRNVFISIPGNTKKDSLMCGFSCKNGILSPITAAETKSIVRNDQIEYCNLSI